jgi:glycosyltransferase involved in cell wall biosynthesis
MRILFFGTYDVSTHPRVRVLQQGLRACGHDVVECNVPLGLGTAERVDLLRRPARLPLLVARILRRWLTLVRRSRSLRPVDAVVVGYLGHFDVLLARRLFRRTPVVLDHLISASDTAVDRGERAQSPKVRALAALDRAATGAADVVVVDTEEHVLLVPPAARERALVVAVGAPEEWFGPEPAPAGDVVDVVFFGLYTPLQGAPHIGRAIGALADEPRLRFTMCGSGQDLAETRRQAAANPRVTWRDWVAPDELRELVAGSAVCLGILGTGPKALRVVPNKVFQGAAAGCAVVTSDTPPQRLALGDAACYVPPGDSDALAATLRALAADPARLQAARVAAHSLALDRFRPAAVVAPLHAHLGRTA